LLKNPECKNYIQYSEKFQGNSVRRASANSSKFRMITAHIQCSEIRAHSVFQGKQKLLKHPECKKYIKYSEDVMTNSVFRGKRKFLKNPER